MELTQKLIGKQRSLVLRVGRVWGCALCASELVLFVY